ncbi:hypothetical protein MICAH_3650016 [Microcystis aeruginosa PCC 9809]|uniref:Uncharacterized protein n=1 Tax=Microcystis aeruginosa PCC 9809 TaxID=1160285 RepID=I4HUR2_MICAE|nr:hypothetical protein MICAH_3650016 [Microcystis aeruginosa PCC 9809]
MPPLRDRLLILISLRALVKPILAVTAVKLISNQLSVISYQLSVISYQLSVESSWLKAIIQESTAYQ